ncbi:MAG: hypothetical protein LBR65_05880 [Culturomica sp.]|nr:hypothetical protein [Culturomica sp.]
MIVLILLFLVLSCPLFGQDTLSTANPATFLEGLKPFVPNPPEFLEEIKPYRNKKEYDAVIADLQQRIQNDTSQYWCYYQLACMYSLKQDTTQAFVYLHKALNYGVRAEDVLSDTDFQNLHNTGH